MVYGEELWPELTDFMRKDIRDTVYQYYVDRRAFSFLNEIMPTDVPYDMLTEKGQKSFTQNPSHPLRLALAYNNLLDWKPKSPTLLVYCTADDQVDFTNSLDAYDAWTGNGAKDVTVIDADASLNHTECVIPALTEAKQWLNGVEASAE
jgi:hypothetical protein